MKNQRIAPDVLSAIQHEVDIGYRGRRSPSMASNRSVSELSPRDEERVLRGPWDKSSFEFSLMITPQQQQQQQQHPSTANTPPPPLPPKDTTTNGTSAIVSGVMTMDLNSSRSASGSGTPSTTNSQQQTQDAASLVYTSVTHQQQLKSSPRPSNATMTVPSSSLLTPAIPSVSSTVGQMVASSNLARRILSPQPYQQPSASSTSSNNTPDLTILRFRRGSSSKGGISNSVPALNTSSSGDPYSSPSITNDPGAAATSPVSTSMGVLNGSLIAQNLINVAVGRPSNDWIRSREGSHSASLSAFVGGTGGAGRNSEDLSSTSNGTWGTISARLLPLFNGEGLQGNIEYLNDLVSHWVAELQMERRSPYENIQELLITGVLSLGNKIIQAGDETLIPKVVELWSFTYGTIVPYVEGVFLPLKLKWRPRAPANLSDPTHAPINVKQMIMTIFRDMIILPMESRLEGIFPKLFVDVRHDRRLQELAARFTQMMCILQVFAVHVEDDRAIRLRALHKALKLALLSDDNS